MESQERECFIFYRSFFEALQDLKDKDRLQTYDAICELALNGKDVNLTGLPKTIFTVIKPIILTNTKRYENGKKGGRPKKETIDNEEEKTNGYENKKTIGYEKKESIDTHTKKPNNVNVYVNVNDKKIGSGEEEKIINEIIEYLNTKAGTSFRKDTKSTTRSIKARLNEHYTLDDFKKVIDVKSKEWLGTDMQKYLRPETLFGNKFESYLNEKSSVNNILNAQKEMALNDWKPDGIHKVGERFKYGQYDVKFKSNGTLEVL